MAARSAAFLPDKPQISTITLVELSVGPHLGPHVATTASQRAARQAPQQAAAHFDPFPFDTAPLERSEELLGRYGRRAGRQALAPTMRSLPRSHLPLRTACQAFMTNDQGLPLEELSAVELRGDSFESEYTAIRGRENARDPVGNRPR
jgi:hypothetical protein